MRCAVYSCSANNNLKIIGPNLQFYSFPKEEPARSIWVNRCCRADHFNADNSRICSTHFKDEDYVRNLKHELLDYKPKNYRQLKKNAVPSVNIPKSKASSSECSSKFRLQRRGARERKQIVDSVINSSFTNAVNTATSESGGIHNNHSMLPDSSTNAFSLESGGSNNMLLDTCVSKGVNTEHDDRDVIADKKNTKS